MRPPATSESSDFPIAGLIALVLCCVFLATSLIIWIYMGRDKAIVDIVEFYPPDGLNCAEIAYAYYGHLSNKDCVPMIIGLASKGYIQIIQNDDKGKDFTFRILRHYEGSDEAELLFMDGLRKYGELVTKKEMENDFYKTLNAVSSKVKDLFRKKLYYEKTLLWRYITFPFALVPYLIGLKGPIERYLGEPFFGIGGPVFLFAAVTAFTLPVTSKKSNVFGRVFSGILGIGTIAFHAWFFRDALSYSGVFTWVVYAACILANIFQVVFYRIIDKRTDYGIDLLGRINGFRNYLMTAERPHLVALVDQDPQYFYKILPYTYVLNITDKWVEQFESIAMEPPGWYHGPYGSTFQYHSFNTFMAHTMTSAQMAMTSTPSSSSSGGGFSGGGGGGGGGGSW